MWETSRLRCDLKGRWQVEVRLWIGGSSIRCQWCCKAEILAPSELPAAFLGNSRSMASAPCEPVSLRLAERATELERKPHTFAIPTPRSARKLSTWNPPCHVEGAYPQNYMVEQLRNQVSEMHFEKYSDPSTFQCWKTNFKTVVCSCSSFLTEAMWWMKEVEMVGSVDDLEISQSIGGHKFQKFEMLDAKIASTLKKIILNFYFKKKVNLEERKGADARPISQRKTDCLHDLRILPGHWSQ